MGRKPRPNRALEPSERQITEAIFEHWRVCGAPGTLLACVPNQNAHGQAGLTAGVFDLIALGPKLPVGFLELKTHTGVVSKAQQHFGDVCERLSIPHAIARGRDEPVAILRSWGILR